VRVAIDDTAKTLTTSILVYWYQLCNFS